MVGPIIFVTQRKICGDGGYFEDGIGQFGLIYDVMRSPFYGVENSLCRNEVGLTPFMDPPLESFLGTSNVGALRKNDWGMADLEYGFSWHSGLRKCRY